MRYVLVCLLATSLAGQVRTGSISGRVADPDGAGVPQASIQATLVPQGAIHKAVSTVNGAYTLAELPAGTYDITVPAFGFTFPKLEQKAVVVKAGETTRLDLHLVWGGNLGTPGDDIASFVRRNVTRNGPAPRTRDGKPDFSGVWLGNNADSEDVQALPWADKIVKERRARGGAGQPGESCLPGDVLLISGFLYKVIQTPSVMAILWEGNVPGVTQIFLDGRPHPKVPIPSWMGHSVGHWERDTLVVDTVGFNDMSWIRLFPHTEMLHVVQRYRRPDLAHLEKDLLVEDPGAFAKPWKSHVTWDLAPSEEVLEYVCNENEKDAVRMKK